MVFETRIARRVSLAVERNERTAWIRRGGRSRLRGTPAWAVMALLAVIALSPIVASALPPAGMIVVSPTSMAGWTIQVDAGVSATPTAAAAFVSGPGTPPLGGGSAALTVGTDGDSGVQLRNPGYAGTLLSDITALSYSTYVSAFNGCQAAYLILSIDYTGDGLQDDALFFEPCYQTGAYIGDTVPAQGAPVLNTWQTWNALSGGWWAFNAGTFGPPVTTISSYLGAHPGARIVNRVDGAGGVRLAAGYGAGAWDNFVGNVDSVTIGVGGLITTFNFDWGAGPAHLDIGGNGLPYDLDFSTIQGAVNAASNGDAVVVDPGTYSELLVITKSITLEGAQAGTSACGRSGSESVVGTPNGAFQVLADDVTIDGFTITGVDGGVGFSSLGAGIWTAGTTSGHQIRNNIITGNTMGIYLNSDGTFPSVVERNSFDSNNVAGAAAGTGVYSDLGANDITIRDNCFTGHDNAAMVFAGGFPPATATQSDIRLTDNVFQNDAGGAVFFFTTGLQITGNSWTNSAGTSVFLGGGVHDVTITGNTFRNAAFRGIRVLAGLYGDTELDTNVVARFNNFVDNTEEGLRVDAASYSGGLDATCNWWGDPSGPAIASNPAGTGDGIFDADGVVAFIPWLATSIPNPCGAGPVHLDIGSNGVVDVSFGTIGPAVSSAHDGDTISVDAGTYPELVVVDKSLTFRGAESGVNACSGRAGPESIVGSSEGAFLLFADHITLDGFTVTGVTGGYTAGIYTSGGFSGYDIRNKIVRDNVFGLYLNSNGAFASSAEFNLFENNNNAGAASGNGIYSDQGAHDVAVTDNCFFRNANTPMLFVGGAGGTTTSPSDLTITGNRADNSIALVATDRERI